MTPRLSRLRFQVDRALRPGVESSRRFGRMVDDVRAELAELHDRLVLPLADRIAAAQKLSIVPHGPLHLVPFPALWDGHGYLLERFALHTAPSASILEQLAGGGARSAPDLAAVVIGVADDVAPRIADEVAAVSRALLADSAAVLTGEAATAAAVPLAARARVLHLACHGAFNPHTPMASGLRLADRWLTVRDISSMRLAADLVTLSGCETGVNVVHAGDELTGLLRGFFAAGARALVVSLWRAHDEAACDLMCDFYDRWEGRGRETPAGTARLLRSAQLHAMERHPHPAHWAPFVLVGES